MKNDLLPCPFCGGEVELRKIINGIHGITCSMCYAIVLFPGDEERAITSWNARPEPEPRALTVEELRGMDGKPVYIVEHPNGGHWELSEYAEDYFEDRDTDFYGLRGCNLGWLAYDRQPKGD